MSEPVELMKPFSESRAVSPFPETLPLLEKNSSAKTEDGLLECVRKALSRPA